MAVVSSGGDAMIPVYIPVNVKLELEVVAILDFSSRGLFQAQRGAHDDHG